MGSRAKKSWSSSSAADVVIAIASLRPVSLEEVRVRVLEYAAGLRLRLLCLSCGLSLGLITHCDFLGYELAEGADLLALW